MPSHSQYGGSRRSCLIDILLPVHNGAPFLTQSIESIQAQTEQSWRLWVLDDGSTDKSARIAKNFAEKDSRIRLVCYPARGLIATLNAGLKLCRAPFVARQDADDISLPHRFAVELDYLRNNPKCIAVSGGGITIDETGKRISGKWFHNSDIADPCWVPAREPYLMHSLLMARREIYQHLGYRNFFICEDADLCWRFEEKGEIHSIAKVLGYYRTSEKSVSTQLAVNTRIQAIVSQLAAIGAQRRREGRGDFNLNSSLYKKMVKANDFESIIEIFQNSLSASEFQYLRSASIIKFMDIASYRPSKVNTREVNLAYQELYAISRREWSGKNSILYICYRAYHALCKRGYRKLARKLTPSFIGWVIIAMNQSWLSSQLPPPSNRSRLLGRRSPRASVQA